MLTSWSSCAPTSLESVPTTLRRFPRDRPSRRHEDTSRPDYTCRERTNGPYQELQYLRMFGAKLVQVIYRGDGATHEDSGERERCRGKSTEDRPSAYSVTTKTRNTSWFGAVCCHINSNIVSDTICKSAPSRSVCYCPCCQDTLQWRWRPTSTPRRKTRQCQVSQGSSHFLLSKYLSKWQLSFNSLSPLWSLSQSTRPLSTLN